MDTSYITNTMLRKTKIFFSLCFTFSFLLIQTNNAQHINKGMWYHQQPTSVNDTGAFYGGKKTFEGFCGPTAVGMGLQYFIPNIHSILYDLYGGKDFHEDSRGGLKNADPYCYNDSTTYTFEDFLGHNYIGRHIDSTGCNYNELKSLITSVDSDLVNYYAETSWVTINQIKEYLERGYLIVLNTKQGDGHYILIGEWSGESSHPDQFEIVIWDGWKYPLDLDSTEYVYTDNIVGNKANVGSASRVLCYKINISSLRKIFKDQRGDGTMLAFRFRPVDLPPNELQVKTKGIWVNCNEIEEEGYERFFKNLFLHRITDIFVQVDLSNEKFSFDSLNNILSLAHKKNIKVHVVISEFNNSVSMLEEGYCLNKGSMELTDKSYLNKFLNNVIKPLCRLNVDGIHLDCSVSPEKVKDQIYFEKGSTDYYRLIRQYVNNNQKRKIELSTSVIPCTNEISEIYGKYISAITKYLDFITPTLYTHNYNTSPSWVGSQTKYFIENTNKNCEVWPVIQTLDTFRNCMTSLEMEQCTSYALWNGSKGIIYFCYPLELWQWQVSDQLTSD